MQTWTKAQWEDDIKLAQAAHIDAFVLNTAESNPKIDAAIQIAFEVATSLDFGPFFSFE